jgi:hypothetical protein
MKKHNSENSSASAQPTPATNEVPAGSTPEPAASDQASAPDEKAPEAGPTTEPKAEPPKQRRKPTPKPTSKQLRRSPDPKAGTDKTPKAGSLTERLLEKFELPKLTLDRALLPLELLAPLDAAGLGAAATLPASAFMTLAAIAAVAGPNTTLEPCVDEKLASRLTTNGLSLRIASLTEERRSAFVPAAILAAVYAAENTAFSRYREVVQRNALKRRAHTKRRALHEQASQAAVALGIEPPPPLAEALAIEDPARPRIVLPRATGSAIAVAAPGGTGVLIVDDRGVPSLLRVGQHFDEPLSTLLGTLNLGHQSPFLDPSGLTTMRALPASVLGQLTTAEVATLYRADPDQFGSTVFVSAAAPAPVGADSSGLIALMLAVQTMADEPIILRMPAKTRHALVTAVATWDRLAATALPPLSDLLAGLPDLARRLAAGLHLVAAAGANDKPSPEITPAAMQRAVKIVDAFVIPFARAVLGPLSVPAAERDGREIIDHLRETASGEPVFERRPLMRAWRRRMPGKRLDAALEVLQQERLLVALDKVDGKGGGGQRFQVDPAILRSA